MGTRMRLEVGKGGGDVGLRGLLHPLAILLAAAWGCSGGSDETTLLQQAPEPPGGAETPAFLGFPPTAADSASSPALLSETVAFPDLARLEAAPGVLPYSVQSPLWSDGAQKRRWMALPSGAQIGFSE